MGGTQTETSESFPTDSSGEQAGFGCFVKEGTGWWKATDQTSMRQRRGLSCSISEGSHCHRSNAHQGGLGVGHEGRTQEVSLEFRL